MNLALALSFVQAPFNHVHEHEINRQHAGAFLHTHVSHTRANGPGTSSIDDLDPDNDARPQNWFAATCNIDQFSLVVSAQRVDVEPVLISEPCYDRLVLSGHDPPVISRSNPRAPPV